MNFNDQLICVDKFCNLSFRRICNWQDFIEHQNFEHKMLTLTQFEKALKKKYELYSYLDYQMEEKNLTQKALSVLEDDINYIRNIMLEQIEQIFENLQRKCSIEIQQKVENCFQSPSINLNYFATSIQFSEYQEQCLNFFNSNFESEMYQNVKNCTNFIKNQIDLICKTLERDMQKMSQQIFEILSKTKTVDQSVDKPILLDQFSDQPLKGYRQTNDEKLPVQSFVKQPKGQNVETNDTQEKKQKSMIENQQKTRTRDREKTQQDTQNSLDSSQFSQTNQQQKTKKQKQKPQNQTTQNQKQKAQPTQSISANSQQVQSKNLTAYPVQKPNFLLTNKICQISQECFQGRIIFTPDKKGAYSQDDGFAFFEGNVSKFTQMQFSILIVEMKENQYLELGIINWGTFVSPKQKELPQAGVYSINSNSCVFCDQKKKVKNNLFIQKSKLTVQYTPEKSSLEFIGDKFRQFIILKNIDLEISFFVCLRSAEIVIV